MTRYVATGSVVGGTYIGEIEANTPEEAISKARRKCHVSLCHACAKGLSDLEVEQVTVMDVDTGEETEEET